CRACLLCVLFQETQSATIVQHGFRNQYERCDEFVNYFQVFARPVTFHIDGFMALQSAVTFKYFGIHPSYIENIKHKKSRVLFVWEPRRSRRNNVVSVKDDAQLTNTSVRATKCIQAHTSVRFDYKPVNDTDSHMKQVLSCLGYETPEQLSAISTQDMT
ncbi:hypothetical protein C0J52_10624, partial [Blattella germanica]